ncbi:N-acetyltransferase [Acrocarpospora phusangensis]|uniref:N-acetyltransferase n=1 Tax=Acrocarpospora phusangensis TaxID=1070424 RepID=A0A919UQ89_9ACTN|nr:GNAT family protein [Acrocarpospora phusangensis]GIH26163.1 N-acetyltransferase [Acrocarpospora phusangensis]
MTATMPAPVTLEGRFVRLEPLTLDHVPDLFAAGGGDDDVWRWMPAPTPRTEQDMSALAAKLIVDPHTTPLAVIHDNRAVGWSTYLDCPGFDASVEIGWTWYGQAHWRSPVNTECKILLIDHAIDKLGFNRVQLKTDNMNIRSQTAIRRIGGVHEGTLRRHRPRPDGTWRDTVVFSILDDEWPPHRTRLQARLDLPQR